MKRVRRKYVYVKAHRVVAAPFDDLLSVSTKDMSREELANHILARLQQLQRTTDMTDVAWWIALQRKKPGRPPGRLTELRPRARAAEWIKQQLKRRKRRWCRENGRERASRDATTKLASELIAEAGKRYPGISAPFQVGKFLRDK